MDKLRRLLMIGFLSGFAQAWLSLAALAFAASWTLEPVLTSKGGLVNWSFGMFLYAMLGLVLLVSFIAGFVIANAYDALKTLLLSQFTAVSLFIASVYALPSVVFPAFPYPVVMGIVSFLSPAALAISGIVSFFYAIIGTT